MKEIRMVMEGEINRRRLWSKQKHVLLFQVILGTTFFPMKPPRSHQMHEFGLGHAYLAWTISHTHIDAHMCWATKGRWSSYVCSSVQQRVLEHWWSHGIDPSDWNLKESALNSPKVRVRYNCILFLKKITCGALLSSLVRGARILSQMCHKAHCGSPETHGTSGNAWTGLPMSVEALPPLEKVRSSWDGVKWERTGWRGLTGQKEAGRGGLGPKGMQHRRNPIPLHLLLLRFAGAILLLQAWITSLQRLTQRRGNKRSLPLWRPSAASFPTLDAEEVIWLPLHHSVGWIGLPISPMTPSLLHFSLKAQGLGQALLEANASGWCARSFGREPNFTC